MKNCKYILFLAMWTSGLIAQTHSDGETVRISLDGVDEVGLYNHRGAIEVIGSSTGEAVLTYTRKLKSASGKRLEDAKSEIALVSEKENGRLLIFVDAPDLKFQIDPQGRGSYKSPNWNDHSKNRYQVEFEFEIKLEIPTEMDLVVKNHHSALDVRGISGSIRAGNHHKDLMVENAGGHVEAHSHHGDVTVTHLVNPSKDSYYHTHHGDINVSYPKGLNADAKLHTHHGSFYSDFDWEYSALKVSSKKTEKGTKYKIGKDTRVKIGKGGSMLDFDTHHGSIYLRSE